MTYTRWGSSSCPSSSGAELVYSGSAGGTNFLSTGGSAEIICLPDNPDYILGQVPGPVSPWRSVVQGSEYEYDFGSTGVFDHNVPCAVCFVPLRSTSIMIPAKSTCPSSWTLEYNGYLASMAEQYRRTSYTCLDAATETIEGHNNDTDPALFYPTVTDCNGLSCPPYISEHILYCTVCTRWTCMYTLAGLPCIHGQNLN